MVARDLWYGLQISGERVEGVSTCPRYPAIPSLAFGCIVLVFMAFGKHQIR